MNIPRAAHVRGTIMRATSDIKTLTLTGTPRERGQMHGTALKHVILRAIDAWKEDLRQYSGKDPNESIVQFMTDTDLVAATEKWAPQLLEEVKGIGDGAGVDFNTIFMYQCMDEEWWFGAHSLFKRALQCSGLGCYREGKTPALLAQNMDVPNYNDDFKILLRIKNEESSVESFVFSVAGLIGLNGLNNQPLGICCNTLLELNYAPKGLPVAFIVRSVLEQPTLEKAIRFIRRIKHASGQNYIMADSEKVVDFECSANKVCQYTPYKGARRVYHTNHTITNSDLASWSEEERTRMAKEPKGTSRARFDVLEKELKDPSRTVNVKTIKSILASHEGPVCTHNTHKPKGSCTLGTLIMSMSNPPELHLAPGPPCSTEFRTYKF
jgi:isopenicillin-N N-acyltransferase like protein